MCSILFLPLVPRNNRCMWNMFVFMCVVVGVCENVCCVATVVKDSGVLSLGVLYICVRGVMDGVFLCAL